MLLFAKLVAGLLFFFARPRAIYRRLAWTVLNVLVSALTALTVLSWRSGAPAPEQADASVQGTFISANGTTSKSWQIAGPAGAGLYEGDAGGMLVELEGGAQQIADFGDTPHTMTLPAGVSLAGATGAGGVSMGNMTGACTLPTGALSWSGATGQKMTLIGNSTSPGFSLVEDTGRALVIRATGVSGTLSIDGEGSGGLLLGENSQTGGVILGGNGVPVTIGLNTAATATFTGTETFSPFLTITPENFQPSASTPSYACGPGGTQTIGPGAFGFSVTSGTLTSNCVLDFSANNTVGLFYVDISGVALGATFGLEFSNGSATKTITTASASSTLATVWTHGANTLAVRW